MQANWLLEFAFEYFAKMTVHYHAIGVYRVAQAFGNSHAMEAALRAVNLTESEKLLVYIDADRVDDQIFCLEIMTDYKSLKEV